MRQKQALTILMSGQNVFLTGSPGTGKTYVLNKFIQLSIAAGKQVAVTASTGIAASQINGTTIHSWSGLGVLDRIGKEELQQFRQNDRLKKRYLSADILVIDEVSMLHGDRLNMVNQMAKELRESDAPFGGLQVVLAGDLFQLPPVTRFSNKYDFIHGSSSWMELDAKICYLQEQYRQQLNDDLLQVLEAMRSGELEDVHIELLTSRVHAKPQQNDVVTRLYSHNIDVDVINQGYLQKLSGQSNFYRMMTKGRQAKVEQLAKTLLVPEILELKEGAEVMFVANNFANGYVNGTRGTVVGFDSDIPIVQLRNKKQIYIEPYTWNLTEDGKMKSEITQLPLRLAWAVTIHKSQGMSLDAAEIDLSKAFTPGMGYVALSRVRSIDGLYINGINQMALVMNPLIFEIDKQFRLSSKILAENTPDLLEESLIPQSTKPIVDEQLFDKLKKWRSDRAMQENIPAYMIAHNTSLSAIAALLPEDTKHLLLIPGFGAKKVDSYGQEILSVVRSHAPKK